MRKPKPPHCFLSIFFTLVLTGISYGAEKYSNSKVTIHADSINYSATKEVVIATGNVVVKRDQTRLQCDYAKLDNSTEIAVLEGNVIVEDPETRLESRRAVINLKNNMGVIYDATGFVALTYHVSGKRVERISENRYQIEHGSITTCCDRPAPWKIRAKSAHLHLEHYAYLSHPTFQIRKFPVFYFPYFVFPVKTKRQTGLLPPVFGGSGKEGITVTNTFFWAINESQDATVSWQHKELRGDKFDLEYRYILSEESSGIFNGSYTFDFDPETRSHPVLWTINYNHHQKLPFNAKGVVHIDQVSETNPDREFNTGDLALSSKRHSDSYVNISKNWESKSLQLTARRKETIETLTSQRVDEFPSVTFSKASEQIGKTRLYLSLESSYKSFGKTVEDTVRTETRVNRVDALPALSVPLPLAPWFSLTPSASYRYTWYSNGTENKPVSRGFYEAGISLSGPKVYKIFNFKNSTFKHLVEPELSYSHISKIDQSIKDQIISFDGIDKLGRVNGPANSLQYSLSNIVLKKNQKKGVHEIARLQLQHSFDIEEYRRQSTAETPKRPFGQLNIILQTRIHPNLQFDYYNTFDVYSKTPVLETVDFDLNFPGKGYINVERRKKRENSTGQAISITDIGRVGFQIQNMVSLELGIHYDELNDFQKENDLALVYSAECWELSFDLINRRLTDQGTNQITHETRLFFTVTLKDVLTYGEKGPLGFIERRF